VKIADYFSDIIAIQHQIESEKPVSADRLRKLARRLKGKHLSSSFLQTVRIMLEELLWKYEHGSIIKKTPDDVKMLHEIIVWVRRRFMNAIKGEVERSIRKKCASKQ